MTKPGIYQHYKGNKYLVIGTSKHSETLEEMIVYISLYENLEGAMWVRPKTMFEEMIELDGKQVPRFKFLLDN